MSAPLAAHVRPRAQHDEQPDLLRRRQELAEVAVALPVELAAHGLVPVPRDVGLDGVQPHRLEPQQAVLPVLRGHAAVVDAAGAQVGDLAVLHELVVLDRETRGCSESGGGGVG